MKELIKVAKELNKVLGLDPEIPTDKITEKKMLSELKKAAKLIVPSEDVISATTIKKLKELEYWPEADEAEEEEEEEAAPPKKEKKPAKGKAKPEPEEEEDADDSDDDDDDDEEDVEEDEDEDEDEADDSDTDEDEDEDSVDEDEDEDEEEVPVKKGKKSAKAPAAKSSKKKPEPVDDEEEEEDDEEEEEEDIPPAKPAKKGKAKPAVEEDDEEEEEEEDEAPAKPAKKQVPVDPDAPDYSAIIEKIQTTAKMSSADRSDVLKKIVKKNEMFAKLKKKIDGKFNSGELKNEMLEIVVKLEQKAKKAIKAATEPEKKPKAEKAEKKPKTARGEGVIASIVKLIEEADSKKGITKDQILEKLIAKFPDRGEESMRNTIQVQVPNRIRKEHWPVGVTKKGGYFKDE